jgi:EAL domain-containing protein (putative c-di-GMP-specific phosphodiesterase class I)
MPLDVAGRARASDRRVLEEGEVVQEEEVIWRRGGDRTYITQKFPLKDTDGGIYAVCAISTDITERKAREQELRAEVDWSIRVREAVRKGKLILHAQPILELATNSIHQEELLVRMKGERGFEDLVMPGEFLPPAERFGLVQEIDRWVVAEAVKLAKQRRVEVNLSGKSIGDADLIRLIETQLKNHAVDPANVVFEITETAAAENLDAARDFAWRLRGLGCGFALDDFGTGYGTFAYLKHLPVTFIKIDTEFVRYLAIDPSDQKIVKSIIAVAKNFGVQTIAEGVEHQATLDLLRDLGVDYAQGFLIGEPKAVEYVTFR